MLIVRSECLDLVGSMLVLHIFVSSSMFLQQSVGFRVGHTDQGVKHPGLRAGVASPGNPHDTLYSGLGFRV